MAADPGLIGAIGSAVGSIFGSGGAFDQLFYTRDEKAQNQAALIAAGGLAQSQVLAAQRQGITKEVVQIATYFIIGLIVIVLLILAFKYFTKR